MHRVPADFAAARQPVPSNAHGLGRTLFITLDGILEPLGQSQILPYVRGLARLGTPYSLLTLERASDVQGGAADELRQLLANENIGWTWAPYQGGGSAAVMRNCRTLLARAGDIVERENIKLVHARSYVAAGIAWRLKQSFRLPYLFDMRGYWIDERAADGRWFTNPVAYRAGKLIESALVRNAAGVVTLTELQAGDIRQRVRADVPVAVIPTCADFDAFSPNRSRFAEQFKGKLVVGYVGSINSSYLHEPAFRLFRYLRELRPDAHLICLTRQTEEMQDLLSAAGVAPGAYTVATAAHQEMPEWLAAMHWGLLMMRGGLAKRGSMPTKLAEFFAAGVRPVHYGCNDEVARWVRQIGSGISLESVDDSALREAANRIASFPQRGETDSGGSASARAHFGLESGVQGYHALLTTLLSRRQS